MTPEKSPAANARAARQAQRLLGAADAQERTRVLRELAKLLESRESELMAANAIDLQDADASSLDQPLRDRLVLDESKLATLRNGVLQLAESEDPVGRVLRRTELDTGLELTQVTSPLGVMLVIFESRPDAVIQIGALALRSGNAVLLKGGSEARHSNRALVDCLRDALAAGGLDPDAVAGIEGREAVGALLAEDENIDLVIPRGSGDLVRAIQESTRIPVLGHSEGVCHLYLDRSADPIMAARLAVDGKCDYPSACNATETLLVHRDFLSKFSGVAEALLDAGVELRLDADTRGALPDDAAVTDANDGDWRAEYGALILSVKTVDSLNDAIDHIHRYGSSHTESIVAQDDDAAARFLKRVDSASVFHNASTRFADGYRYGLGAEVGISTGRIHARGPVGVDGLLTTRWLLTGNGQAASDYGKGGRSFVHRTLSTD